MKHSSHIDKNKTAYMCYKGSLSDTQLKFLIIIHPEKNTTEIKDVLLN